MEWKHELSLKQYAKAFRNVGLLQNVKNMVDEQSDESSGLQRLNKEKAVLNTTKRRKVEYIAHVIRNLKHELLHIVNRGK